jgi:tetratricopeptide (TPR) repeat protein
MSILLLLLLASDFETSKLEAARMLQAGKFQEARLAATPLAKASPDDIEVWYILAKANRKLGKLTEAEKQTQWMLDMRPENPGALWEAALLREQFKDLSGALDLLNDVYHRTPASKHAERAELLTDIARIFTRQGKTKDAAMLRTEIAKLTKLAKELANETPTRNLTHK